MPEKNHKKPTPMMQQYLDIKEKHAQEIVVFRLGDFYEMFMDDAVLVSKLLQLTLTKRGNIPMCGIPYHAANNYFYKLINYGHKIAIVEQVEKESSNSNLMKREVVHVITPGTVVDTNNLEENKNNFLLQLKITANQNLDVAALDISTGYLECTHFAEGSLEVNLSSAFSHYEPKEILIAENDHQFLQVAIDQNPSYLVNEIPAYVLEHNYGEKSIKALYSLSTLKSLGLEESPRFVSVLSGLLYYLKNNHLSQMVHIHPPKIIDREEFLRLDHATITNLELIRNNQDGSENNSLFSAINHTVTPMGGRLLRHYILKPLLKRESIENRQSKVAFLIENPTLYRKLTEQLKNIYDFERLLSKLSMGKITPRECITLKNSLVALEKLIDLTKKKDNPLEIFPYVNSLKRSITHIATTLLDEPHNDINEGGVIRNDFDKELDELRQASQQGADRLIKLLEKEKSQTNIPNLKIKYTDNSGYFFEVTKGQLANVPSYFIKRTTMVNVARYTTEKLLQYQEDILSAKERVTQLEITIYDSLKNDLKQEISYLQAASEFCAEVDILMSFATSALRYRYCMPSINESRFEITGGRHPVMEQIERLDFIPNDLEFKGADLLHIITGPNMGGKSTYLRQNALIVLLAQIGSFVPARKASITICDRIFTRIGAGDNLIKGESTFLAEMSETGYILSQATEKSLIIMDEIGRGTSTYDGLSLAWGIIEFISHPRGPRSKTLFATHYHELTELENDSTITNYHVSVVEEHKEILFTKKVTPGSADKSYGIHVASLAGLPYEVIKRAKKKLLELENHHPAILDDPPSEKDQISMFKEKKAVPVENPIDEMVIKSIKNFDLNNSTPIDSFLLLEELKKKIK